MNPRVSVVMSVYNSERFLGEAIQSILDQTFTDFEFIIIDDGSTDRTAAVLDGFTDPRFVNIRNEKNIGLTASLNKGLALARGEYIARMDADDISQPDRFEKQIEYLDEHPAVGIIGTGFRRIDQQGKEVEIVAPSSMAALTRWTLLFGNCLCHSSVVMRRAVLEQVGYYCPEYLFAQDYELWLRAARDTEITNLGEVLHSWRKGDDQISVKNKGQQDYFAASAQRAAISWVLGKEMGSIVDFRKMLIGLGLDDARAVGRVTSLILNLYHAFLRQNSLDGITRRLIAHYTADKLLFLATKNMNTSFWSSVYAFVRAKMLDPRLPGLQTLNTMLHSLMNRPTSLLMVLA